MELNDIYAKAWTHFDMVAKQRISTFNLYLIILGVMVTASVAFTKGVHARSAILLLSSCSILVPLSFLLIDFRLCRLLRNLKKPLFELETRMDWPSVFMPFHVDASEQKTFWHRVSSYTFVFRGIFLIHGLGGAFLFWHGVGYVPSARAATTPPIELRIQCSQSPPQQLPKPAPPPKVGIFLLPQEK